MILRGWFGYVHFRAGSAFQFCRGAGTLPMDADSLPPCSSFIALRRFSLQKIFEKLIDFNSKAIMIIRNEMGH